MAKTVKKYTPNLTTELIKKIDKYLYIVGLPNFWVEKPDLPRLFIKFHPTYAMILHVAMVTFVLMELTSMFREQGLTYRQRRYRLMLNVVHPILQFNIISIIYQKHKVRNILYCLSVTLKEVFNVVQVERDVIRKSLISTVLFMFVCTMSYVMISVQELVDVFRAGKTFSPVIVIWPTVDDTSTLANFGRAVEFILLWIFEFRSMLIYGILFPLIIDTSHQYKILQIYFMGLRKIFDEPDLNQTTKEEKFERSFKVGIKLHVDTLWCLNETQEACGLLFSGQIILNVFTLLLILVQMITMEHTMANLLTTAMCTATTLVATGFLMWNTGDVTVEAAKLVSAMYGSGWECCTGASAIRVRSMLVIAMMQGQVPVILRGLGIMELSYDSYVKIIKTSYSIFSVIY